MANQRKEDSTATTRASTTDTNTFPLILLSDATKQHSTWTVTVDEAGIEEYTYDAGTKTAKLFKCLLISVSDNTHYAKAEIRKTKGCPPDIFDKAAKTFQNGFTFKITKVALNNRAKSEYIHTPCKVIIDLTFTTTTKLLVGIPATAQPSITCAECLLFKQLQAFDICAFVVSVSDKRDVKNDRKVRDLWIIDGTSIKTPLTPAVIEEMKKNETSSVSPPTETEELVKPKIQVYYSTIKGDDPPFIKTLLDNQDCKVPFNFFGLIAQFKNQGYSLETLSNGYLIKPATGARAEALMRERDSILTKNSNMSVRILENKWEPSQESFVGKPAAETFCAHLADMAKPTGIQALDDKPTLWQTNWSFGTIQQGSMLNEKGQIWLNLILQDLTGQTKVTLDEKAALSLSGGLTKESFLQSVNDGDPVFPTILSAKIVRKLKTLTQESEPREEQQGITYVNNHVIEISRQDETNNRSSTSQELLNIIRTSATMSTSILPVSLSMLTPSVIYPLLVQYPAEGMHPQPCRKIWILLKVTKKSVATPNEPYQVITDDVEDVLETDTSTAGQQSSSRTKTKAKYKMISMCKKENQNTLMLSPTHGKPLYALAVITAVHDNTLFAENVESLQQDDKDKYAKAMKQEMLLVTHLLNHTSSGKTIEWNETTSPLTSSRCRSLSKSPTGPDLDLLELHEAKKQRTE